MFIAAYNKKRDLFTPITDVPLEVLGAGYMSVETKAPTNRPNGTPSYQLIYIKKTKNPITFLIGDKTYTAQKDDLIIYRPNETQKYNYCVDDEAISFWIHFDGTEAENIMKRFDIHDIRVLKITDQQFSFPAVIKKIINEINTSHYYSNDIIYGELYTLLAEIAQINFLSKNSSSKINEIINEIKLNFTDNTSNEEYAHKCGLSVPHFLRNFKQVTGTSPHNYKLNIRLEYAKRMISSTELNINEIAQTVGYNDPYHFSRYFKKATGCSPKEYRANFQKKVD